MQKFFDMILNKLEAWNQDKPFIIGINGIDASGKTSFAKSLTSFLQNNSFQTQLVHLDDFHNPKSIRYSGKNEFDNYYNHSFDLKTLIVEILEPIAKLQPINKTLQILNLETDNYDLQRTYNINSQTVVILEGVFLFRPELSKYLDYRLFLKVSFKTALKRAYLRDFQYLGADLEKKYSQKYFPAQMRYLKEIKPLDLADLVIVNE
jgi:uridine kinase